jgi:hypothetical protein
MTPEFHPAAQEELAAAVKTGEERGAGLGHELLQEVRRVVGMVCGSPEIGKPLGGVYRRFPLRRFPFGVVYRIEGNICALLPSHIGVGGLGTGGGASDLLSPPA